MWTVVKLLHSVNNDWCFNEDCCYSYTIEIITRFRIISPDVWEINISVCYFSAMRIHAVVTTRAMT